MSPGFQCFACRCVTTSPMVTPRRAVAAGRGKQGGGLLVDACRRRRLAPLHVRYAPAGHAGAPRIARPGGPAAATSFCVLQDTCHVCVRARVCAFVCMPRKTWARPHPRRVRERHGRGGSGPEARGAKAVSQHLVWAGGTRSRRRRRGSKARVKPDTGLQACLVQGLKAWRATLKGEAGQRGSVRRSQASASASMRR